MNPHARYHPRSAEIEIHTHHATHTHTHTRTHKSCPCLPRRRPPPTPLARRAAQRRSCLSLWGGRRCAAPPSYTRDSTVIKGRGGPRGVRGRGAAPGCARCPSRALGRKFHVITIHVSVGPLTPPRRELRRLRRKKVDVARTDRAQTVVFSPNKAALCPALVNATREV